MGPCVLLAQAPFVSLIMVIRGHSRPTEVEHDLVRVGPLILCLRGELGSVFDADRFGQLTLHR